MDFEEAIHGINPYDVYKTCYSTKNKLEPTLHQGKSEFLLTTGEGVSEAKRYYTPSEFSRHLSVEQLRYIPECFFAKPLIDYLTTSTVREQLHIPAEAPNWELCKNIPYIINKTTSTLDIYKSLEKKNLRVLKYSGNTDLTVSTYGTRKWVDELGLPVHKHWSQFFVKEQVGGYYETMGTTGQFTFATVHGAGHQAVVNKPEAVYQLVFNFIHGKDKI